MNFRGEGQARLLALLGSAENRSGKSQTGFSFFAEGLLSEPWNTWRKRHCVTESSNSNPDRSRAAYAAEMVHASVMAIGAGESLHRRSGV